MEDEKEQALLHKYFMNADKIRRLKQEQTEIEDKLRKLRGEPDRREGLLASIE